MSYIASYNINTGEITGVFDVPVSEFQYYEPYIECDNKVTSTSHIVKNGVLTSLEISPSKYHELDYSTETWIITSDQLNKVKNDTKQQISNRANSIHISPIVYDNKTLDANETAQQNINGKISQLQNEISLNITSTDLFWKDHDNVIHTWTDAGEYLAWLQGLQIVIATRRSNLYNVSWTGKSAIDALTTYDDVSNYSIDTLFSTI